MNKNRNYSNILIQLTKLIITLLLAISISITQFSTVFAEEADSRILDVEGTDGDFSMEPVTEFYEYEIQKDDYVDVFGGEDVESLLEQLNEGEVVLEPTPEDDELIQSYSADSLDDNVVSFRSAQEPVQNQDEPLDSNIEVLSTQLTMGFLQPLGKSNATSNVYPTSNGTVASTYISASVSYTGVIPFVEFKDGRYRVVVSGVDGWVNASDYRAYAADTKQIRVNHYTKYPSGTLFHFISRAAINSGTGLSYDGIGNGISPSYLTEGVDYFSSDGHYFYRDTITMLNDYKNKTRANSINPSEPYYNYFQYLSYRTKSNILTADLDSYIKNEKKFDAVPTNYETLKPNESMFVGSPIHFITSGLKHGANPLMTFTLGLNESSWGRSYISVTKKNLFGHAAYDSSASSATAYKSVLEGIEYHNQYYINNLYGRLNSDINKGTYFGDKSSGMNVKYASDPYWGEKAAANYTVLNNNMGNKDYNKNTIGIVKSGINEVTTYKETNTTTPVYKLKSPNQAVNIISSIKVNTGNTSETWYKISSDVILDSNRNPIIAEAGTSITNAYDYNKNHVYVHSSFIDIVAGKSVASDIGRKGDVNGDGKITLIDLALVKSHLLKNSQLSGDLFYRADVNNDSNLTLIDLALIKSHLLGNTSLD